MYAEFLDKASRTALTPVVVASTLPQMLLIAPFVRAHIAGSYPVHHPCKLLLETSHYALSDAGQLQH